MKRIHLCLTFFICAGALVQSAAAQESLRLSAGAVGTSVSAASVLSNGSARMSGTLYGGEGLFEWRRISLRAAYSEGILGFGQSQFAGGTGDANEGGVVGGILRRMFPPGPAPSISGELKMAEGYALVGWRVIPDLEIGTGLLGRARIDDPDSERLLLILLRARYESAIASQQIRGFVEGWTSVAGSASGPERSASGNGGAAGIIVEFGPLGVRMSYAVDHSRYSGDLRRETVQGLALSLGYIIR